MIKRIVISLVFLVLYSIFQLPLWKNVSSQAQYTAQVRALKQREDAISREDDQIKQLYEQYVVSQEQFDTVVPDDEKLTQAVADLEAIAQDLGLTLSITSIGEPIPLFEDSSLVSYVTSIVMIGEPGKMLNYLKQIENRDAVTAISTLSIKTQPPNYVLNANIKLLFRLSSKVVNEGQNSKDIPPIAASLPKPPYLSIFSWLVGIGGLGLISLGAYLKIKGE